MQLSYCENPLVGTLPLMFGCTEGEFSMANSPNLSFGLWGVGRGAEHPEETHADTGRICKLHTDRVSSRESTPGPWRCEAAVIITEPPCRRGHFMALVFHPESLVKLFPAVFAFSKTLTVFNFLKCLYASFSFSGSSQSLLLSRLPESYHFYP